MVLSLTVYQKSWTKSRLLEQNISPNLMFDGIQQHMYASKMATNGKWHSKPTKPTLDYMNQPSCSLGYATPL